LKEKDNVKAISSIIFTMMVSLSKTILGGFCEDLMKMQAFFSSVSYYGRTAKSVRLERL
jgi:hypothetical protein